jgi:hypothetical protein
MNRSSYSDDWCENKPNLFNLMAREIAYQNDCTQSRETPEERWSRMRAWIAREIRNAAV